MPKKEVPAWNAMPQARWFRHCAVGVAGWVSRVLRSHSLGGILAGRSPPDRDQAPFAVHVFLDGPEDMPQAGCIGQDYWAKPVGRRRATVAPPRPGAEALRPSRCADLHGLVGAVHGRTAHLFQSLGHTTRFQVEVNCFGDIRFAEEVRCHAVHDAATSVQQNMAERQTNSMAFVLGSEKRPGRFHTCFVCCCWLLVCIIVHHRSPSSSLTIRTAKQTKIWTHKKTFQIAWQLFSNFSKQTRACA
jgi:hypothetical protein